MSTAPLPMDQFAARVRGAYPGAYDHLTDADLVNKVVTKYPEYKEKVASYAKTDFEKNVTGTGELTAGGVASGAWDAAKGFGASILHGLRTLGEAGDTGLEAGRPRSPRQGGAFDAQRSVDTVKQMVAEDAQRKQEGYSHLYRAVAPVAQVAGIANPAQDEADARRGESGKIAGRAALTSAMAVAASPSAREVLGEIPGVQPAVEAVTRPVANLAKTAGGMLKGEPPQSMIPEAQKALTQAIQPGVNVPRAQESIKIAGPRMAQVMRDQGLNLTRETGEGAVPNTQKVLDLVKASKKTVIDAVQQRLGPVKDLSPDTSEVADAMEKTITKRMEKQYPEQAAAIRARADTYRTPTRLGDIEEHIQDANNELRNFYKHPGVTDSPISANMAATEAEVSALRRLQDRSVESLGGEGVKDLKREYGALRDVERSAARQHAVATRVKGASLWEGLAYLRAAGELFSGNPLAAVKGAGILSVGKMLKNLRDPNYLLEQAFHGPKAFQPAERIAPSAGPPAPKGLLPAPATELGGPQYQDPAADRNGRWVTPRALLPAPGEAAAPRSTPPPKPLAKFAKEAIGNVSDPNRLGARGEGGVRTTPKGLLPEETEPEEAHIPGVTEKNGVRLARAAREKPIHEKYDPETIADAEGLIAQEVGAMQAMPRPGHYQVTEENLNPNAANAGASGQRGTGEWYGVKSGRGMMQLLKEHPEWTPAMLEKALRNKDSALYRRAMEAAIDLIRREKPGSATSFRAGSALREPGEEGPEEVPF